jgi:glutathione S-transferase
MAIAHWSGESPSSAIIRCPSSGTARPLVFEIDENSQVVGKYLDEKLRLGLFPADWEGIQDILWRYIENDIEGIGFKLNDIYYQEMVPPSDRLRFLRHKERKFGRGCIDQWRQQQDQMLSELARRLIPFERMLAHRSFLLENRPYFVDFDLYGMLADFLYSGHYELPAPHTQLKRWYEQMARIQCPTSEREKLHPDTNAPPTIPIPYSVFRKIMS